MPNYFRFKDYLLYFYVGDGIEPIHVHVAEKRPSKSSAKFWLIEDGTCQLAYHRANIPNKDLKRLSNLLKSISVFFVKNGKTFSTF